VKVVVHVDGGARGNPGPAAAAAVVSTPGGEVLDEAAVTLGRATNNVAEYRGLIAGLERALDLGLANVTVVSDSELVVKQMRGEYRVKNEALRDLRDEAERLASKLGRVQYTSVRRAENELADRLVNEALDAA
jgi:ribonuclease HI